MKKVAPPPPPPGGASSDQRPPLSNGDLKRQSNHEAPPILRHHNYMSTTPGEDCAFDELLEGRMELEVVLPDNKTVRMTVDRRTPMMDLLVHAATANKISPGGHVIRVVPKISREQQQQEEEEPQLHYPRDVPYKPNTPVGSLDVSTVHIVPKPHPDIPIRRMPKLANQPFEQTFRLQVNLPRNQRMVLRVSPRITLSELKRQICSEKELDHSSHHLVHPAQPDTVLDLNSSLELYGCAEISLMSNSGLRDSIRSTSTHLIGYPRVEDEKKKKGILRLFSKKKKEATVETSNTNGGLGIRGVSPTRNMIISNRDSYQPKQSTKRKPAPAPPPPPPATLVEQPEQPPSPPLVIQSSSSISSKPESEISAKTDELGSTVSHSRHSSDSSGYHEPSVFSDCSQENKSPEASIVQGGGGGGLSTNNVLLCTPPKDVVPPDSLPLLSRQTTPVKEQQVVSLTNLKTVPCCSNTSIVSATRKRKAPLPPTPPVLQEVETPSSPEDLSPLTTNKPVVESQPEISSPSPPPPPPSSESALPADSDPASNEESAGQIEDEETPTTPLPSPAQTPETIRQEKEAITYLENVLKESETATKSPTHLSPELDKRVIANVATEEPSDEADIEIDKSNDERTLEEHDAMDASVIEANASAAATPLVSVPRLESPPADDPSSYPAVITSTEDDVMNTETSEVSSAVTISSSLPAESERLPVDGDKTNDVIISTAKGATVFTKFIAAEKLLGKGFSVLIPIKEVPTPLPRISVLNKSQTPQNAKSVSRRLTYDTSATPSVPSNKDILSQTSDATVESSMQPDLQKPNFVSDFKEKPTEQNLPDKVEQDENNIKVPENADSQQNAIENFSSEVELRIQAPSVKNEVMLDINEVRDQVVSTEPDSGGDSSKEGMDTPKAQRKLVNFALGCYKRDTKDIYNEKQDVVEESKPVVETLTDREQQPVKTDTSVLKSRWQAPDVKIVPFEERSKTDSIEPVHLTFKGQVQQRCTELSKICMLPLTGRSSSLYNLMPQKKSKEDILPKTLLTLPETLKRTQSDQNLSQETSTAEEKLDFIQEQKRLHDEYLKLQAQFISWQKQLLNNQSLLQSEQIMPQLTLPALEQYKIQLEQFPEILQLKKDDINSKNEAVEQLKTRSLPRQKSPSLSVKNRERPNTPVVCQVPKTEDTTTKTPPAQQVSTPDESLSGISSLIVNHISRPEETVIYAQVNKQKKTNKGDHTSSNVNSLEPSNNIPSESPELPKKQLTEEDISKSQTLPRQKTQPISAFEVSRTMTLNRQTRPKSQVVSVTIGSWQQRHQEMPDINSASVASSRSMFQSLENIPRDNSKPNLPTPTESKKFKLLTSISDKKEPPIPDVVTAKVIIKKDGKDIVEDSRHQPESSSNVLAQQKTTKVSRAVEKQNQNSKVESTEIESHVIHSKPSKPLVLLSSMKDETRPPSIQVLKKWPLSNMNEKESPQKTGERSIWSELKASAKLPSGATKERVTRAEVDLRKHRTQKNESSSKSPKNKEPEPSTSKLHISKVNVNIENKTDSSKSSGASSKSKSSSSAGVSSSEKQKKIFPSSKSETLNAELKDVLLKRANSSSECQDSSDGPVESNYAELSNGSSSSNNNNVQSKTVAVNGNSPPPPPPPPVSTMPTIPPAAPIPKSSQLLMGKRTKDSQTKVKTVNSQSKFESRKDPREELMLQIRGFGGRQALRKAPAATAGWNLKVYGTASSLKS